jgi:hypothetical protein
MPQRDKKNDRKGGKSPRFFKTIKKTLGSTLRHKESGTPFKISRTLTLYRMEAPFPALEAYFMFNRQYTELE